jgi:hypothetical protein
VDLSKWAGARPSATVLREATAAIMADVTSLVARLRNEEPPATPYDPALKARTAPGVSPPAPSSPAAATEAPEDSPA